MTTPDRAGADEGADAARETRPGGAQAHPPRRVVGSGPRKVSRSARMTAQERREIIIRVALSEFSTGGYHGTSTERIADRAGISQPYVFRLFPGKKALFLACAELCFKNIAQTLAQAGEGHEGETVMEAMGAAYQQLIADRSLLLFQLQLYVASASAEPDIAELVRGKWRELWDTVRASTGSTDEEVNSFFAAGMYINTLLALGVASDSRCWSGLRPVEP